MLGQRRRRCPNIKSALYVYGESLFITEPGRQMEQLTTQEDATWWRCKHQPPKTKPHIKDTRTHMLTCSAGVGKIYCGCMLLNLFQSPSEVINMINGPL